MTKGESECISSSKNVNDSLRLSDVILTVYVLFSDTKQFLWTGFFSTIFFYSQRHLVTSSTNTGRCLKLGRHINCLLHVHGANITTVI